MNLFIGTEWKRLKIESEKSVAVELEEWLELYNEGYDDYIKANFTD